MSAHDKPDPVLDKALAACSAPGPDSGVIQRVLALISPERVATMSRWTLLRAVGLAAASGMLAAIAPALWHPLPSHAAPTIEPISMTSPVAAHADIPETSIVHADARRVPTMDATASKLPRRAGHRTRHLARVAYRSSPQQVATAQKHDVIQTRATLRRREARRARLVAQAHRRQQKAPIEVQRVTDAPLSISAVSLTPIALPSGGKE